MFYNGWDDWKRTQLRRLVVMLALLTAFGALAVVGDALGTVRPGP